MAISNEPVTLGQLKKILDEMDASDDLMVRVSVYSERPVGVFSVRKHVETDENDEIEDAYIVFNG